MKRRIRFYYLKIMRQSGTPNQIAGGVALGLFIGLVFPPGIQVAIAFVLATMIGCNRLMALSMVWITNPVTMPFIYSFYATLGGYFTGHSIRSVIPTNSEDLWEFLRYPHRNRKLIQNLVIGALLSGMITSLISFYLVKGLILFYQHQKRQRKQRMKKAFYRLPNDHQGN